MFRRLLLPPGCLPEELKRVEDGVLVRLPLAEFDALAERAAQAKIRKASPRLLEARYHATLKEESLIGEGQWKLVHPGPGPGLLRLQPFNLALRQARFENGDALIAAFDGKLPALLVETPGERTVSLDWSARAEPSPEGLQFHLEMPSCPVALVELDIPAGRGVTVLTDGALLSGPHEAESANLRRWKIVCGGRRRVDIRIHPADRPAAASEPSPAPFVRQKTTQKLHPQGLDATFELTLDGLPRGIREMVCECDAELRLRDVVGPGVEGCSFQAGKEHKPSRLTIRLREPVRTGTWQVHCLAPLNGKNGVAPAGRSSETPRSVAWRSPGLRLVNGVLRGETLTLWLHPDLRVEGWDPGSFRLISSDLDRATGSQVLTLAGGASVGPPRRPAVDLQAYSVEFSTHQLTWWRCNAAGMALTVQIGWDVSQGQLFQLEVLVPPGWSVEKVEMNPTALLRDWQVYNIAGKQTLLVDLASPLKPPLDEKSEGRNPKAETGSRVSGSPRRLPALIVHLRPGWSGPFAGKSLPFPDAIPRGARFREGALALDCDEQLFHLQVKTDAERSEPEGEGPWGQQLPEYYYRYRGHPPTGKIQVQARPPRLRAKCKSEVVAAVGEAVVETHLLLEAESGTCNIIELSLSAGDGGPWEWHNEAAPRGEESVVNRVRSAERIYRNETSSVLHLLAASGPLQAAIAGAAWPSGEHWRLTLARPLRLREPLRLHARRRLLPHHNRWDVPLPIVVGAERMEGEVQLHLAGADLMQVQSTGLDPVSLSERGATPWRTFRYGQSEVRLTFSGQAQASARSDEPGVSPAAGTIERARLLTSVGDNGVLRHYFSFQIANWSEHLLPLRLPPGSRPLAVQVDGRWLPRLIPAAMDHETSDSSGEPVELALPVPTRADAVPQNRTHRFEIVYTRTVPAGMFWQSLDASAPQLPFAPLAFRRVWHLPPKLVPLRQERYQSLPGTAGAVGPAVLPRHVAELFHLPGSWARLDPLLGDQQADAREALEQAVEELRRRHAGKMMTLRAVVNDVSILMPTLHGGTHRYPFILDALALREAGVTAETPLTIKQLSAEEATPPWAECGLIAVPARSAILLTTISGRGVVYREPLSEEVENALAAAVKYGQDASGRFRSALRWLQPESTAVSAEGGSRPLDLADEGSDWSEWEPIAGQAEERLIVVRRDGVTALGLALALVLALLVGMLRRHSVRRRLTFLLLVLALSGLGVLWLPASLRDLAWWPLLVGAAAAVLGYFRTVVRKSMGPQSTMRQPKNAMPAAAVAGMLVLGILGWNSRAAAPPPATVYLVPTSDDAPGKPTVLAPADLLDRLKALAQPAPLAPGGPQTVLLDAAYEGQLVEGGRQAEFTAVFSAHSLSDEPSTLTVPLSGVQLVSEVLLDGARAAPLALPAPQAGYSLAVRGRGRHKIELRFRAPVVGTAEDRNVLFTAPPLLRSRLSWRVPAGSVGSQVLVKNGAQWTTRDGGGQRLEADLGIPPLPVHLHWYQPSRPTRIRYQAAYLWDLGLEGNYLTAWLRYRVAQGAVQTLEVDLPADLEVSSANAQRTLSAAPPAWRTRLQLRDWYITSGSGKRTLHLEFPCPISGDFQVTLELLPRGPLTARAALPLPSPRGAEPDGPHYLAYRTQPGLNAQRESSQNLTRIENKEFAPDWLGVPSLEKKFQGEVYRIPPNRPPLLLLRLQQRAPVVQGDVEVTVQASAQRARIEADAEVAAPDMDLVALEWKLPPHCILSAVAGEDVRSWKQNGPHLLVWLKHTTAKTLVHLSGWLSLSRRDGQPHLQLNGPRLLHADKQHTRLRLAAAADLALAAVRTQNLQPVKSETRKPKSEIRKEDISDFQTWNSDYQLDCRVQPAANATARVLTLAEVADRELRFTTMVNYTVRQGELKHVRLRLRNWEEEKVDVQAKHEALRQGSRRSSGERSWLLSLQEGVRGRYQVTLSGSMPLDKAAGGVPMPEVLVQGVEDSDYYLAVAGGELTGQAKGSLQSLRLPHQVLQAEWPEAAQRLERSGGQAWKSLPGAEWQVRLLPQARPPQETPIRVHLQEQWAAVVDGRRWLHEARCWLHHEAHADLRLDFAAPVHVLTAAVDGVEVAPLQLGSARLWLPLPGRPGVRCVRLRWLYDRPEPLDHPNLAPPQLAGAIKGPTLGTVMVPPGWQVSLAGASGWQGTAHEAAELGDGSVGLEELRDKYRSLKSKIQNAKPETPASDSDFGFRLSDLEQLSGTPVSWQSLPGAEPPVFQLTKRESQQTRQALALSALWLGGLTVVWLLSFVPFLWTRVRLFWPEQIAVLAVFGWRLAGLTSIVLGLLLIAACARLFLLVHALRILVRRRRGRSTMTADSGAAS